MIVLGGIHGNEPSGVRAAANVLERIRSERLALRGEWIALAGNLRALACNRRFLDKDLNRQWTEEIVAAVGNGSGAGGSPEDAEQRELLGALRWIRARARGEIFFLDLHTSSAPGPPFLTIGDTLRNRSFAFRLPLPVVLGLEEQIDGALLEYLNNRGCITMGVEAGRHDGRHSADYHEAVLWLALAAAGLLPEGSIPDAGRHRRTLAEAGRGIPRVIEVYARRVVMPADRFRMEPGFENFQPVRRGQVLARDGAGEVRAGTACRILLPLYQGQGEDGFFLCRRVRRPWLAISALLRRLGAGRLVPFLPGVRRESGSDDTLVVDTAIARWFPLEVFHLLGFRKRRRTGRSIVVSRRRFDLRPPGPP